MIRKVPGIQVLRRIVLGLVLFLTTAIVILHQKVQGVASVDALCPFGGFETLYQVVAGGELLKKLEISNFFLLGSVVLLGLLLSRFFCGWLCAFGALQGIVGGLGKRLFKRRFTLPRWVDTPLRYLKYVLLAAILLWTWRAGTLVIRPYDPWAAYAHLSAGLAEVWAEFAIGLVILIATLLLALFVDRPFCKYLCPLGAFNALLGRIPLFRLKREPSTCVSCSLCDRSCPMNVAVMKVDAVSSPECISCFECVSSCPTKKGTLFATLGGKKIALAVVVALGLVVYAAPLVYGRLSGTIRFAPESLGQKAATGTLRVEDIKGSSTWGQIAEGFGVDLERLYREAGVEAAKVPADSKIKDAGALAGIDGFEADTVRVAVARILGLPYEGETGEKAQETGTTAGVPGGTDLVLPDTFTLEGTMTVAGVAESLKTSPEAVLRKLELPLDAPIDRPLKDLKEQYGFTLPQLRERLGK